MEHNGESWEDSRTYPVAVYLNKSLADKAVEDFKESRKKGPVILSEEEWLMSELSNEGIEYDEYVEDNWFDWYQTEVDKTRFIKSFEITES